MTNRPFADAVLAYAQAGWPCIMPVPLSKAPPPEGFTGADGRDTDPVQLALWAGSHATSSIAVRMPDGVIGIDVDQYVKAGVQKHGLDTWRDAVERWGALPETWSSTARGKLTQSRISFYRVPIGRYATKLAGGDVEIIQRHHRYAVVWPSPHPDAGIYTWYDPAGNASEQPPKPTEFPELPQAWVDGLREGATDQGPLAADRGAGERLLAALMADDRPACAELTSAALVAVAELTKADAGSRHDTATERTHHLVQLAAHGHPGFARALPTIAELWENLTAGEGRADEFDRMLLTSARKAVTVVGARPVGNDPCLFTGGLEIASPAPADDRPGAEPPEAIAPALVWNVRQVIGVELFDPRADTDQTLAETVLERMYPAMRYAHDANAWLLRGPHRWERRGELAKWAVSELALMMPRGDNTPGEVTEDRARAKRRTRFLGNNSSSAIANKMTTRVTAGTHPCSLELGQLDAEPDVLWAGGIPWDLRASSWAPVVAPMDPATVHLHSAAVVPAVMPTPLWDAFTAAVWPDPELRDWALNVLAISLTGYPDAALPVLLGQTRRGKTQLIVLLMSVLGSYAHAADPRLLGGADTAHASIVYALKGRRLSFVDEGPREGRWAQERLKQLTGGAELTGNRMRENPVTFAPTHTLVLTANDEPVLTDPAVRARVRLIPCDGDPDQVRATRAAIGHTHHARWRNEAPGVLAAMMARAAAWLDDPAIASNLAAPEGVRGIAEQLADEQDPVRSWVEDETEPHPDGTRSRELYEAFVGWSRNGNTHPSRVVTETKWGREMSRLGYPAEHGRDGKRRPLRIRIRGGWLGPTVINNTQLVTPVTEPNGRPVDGDGLPVDCDGLVTGLTANPSRQETTVNAGVNAPENASVTGVTSSLLVTALTHAPAQAGAPAHTPAPARLRMGVNPSTRQPVTEAYEPHSAKITARLLGTAEATAAAVGGIVAPAALEAALLASAVKPKRTKVDPAERAAAKATAKAQALADAITTASGELVRLPAVVTRDGAVSPIALGDIEQLAYVFGFGREATVDVETTGYPVGHADYALRTIQVGSDQLAVVLDAADPEQRGMASWLLNGDGILHAHSATADLVPLAIAGVLDLDAAWDRMHDTVIPAKLADPQSTGSDPGLKQLAGTVLGDSAATTQADLGRAQLFKAGKWLTDTKVTTPVERSGWAQVARNCATMVRYAASDVLDTAMLAKVLPAVAPAVLERERTAQRMTARVAHQGIRIDGEHVAAKLPEHQAARHAAGELVRGFGIDNPGSDQQAAVALLALGAPLTRTATGRPSVAKGVLEPFQHAQGPIGDLVRAVLDYRHHDTVLGTFLEPYHQLVTRGDGRARPTVYTLGADTGRMSCVRPNLQQVPRQGGMRACFTADPGQLIVSADFASVEIRVAAALSGDANLQAMLDAGVDIHWEIARQVYGPDASKEDRYNTKRGVFGRLYGSGIVGIARTLGISESLAAATVDTLDAMTPGLAEWTAGLKRAVQHGTTQFPTYSGRVVHLDRSLPHKALNYCVQGTARELLVDTLMRWRDTRWGDCVLLPVHDEVLVFVPESEAAEATQALVTAMETSLHGVAIRAEASEPSFYWRDAS